MLPVIQLLRNLKVYENSYTLVTGNLRAELLISKLAILDVCGWVEEAMDELVNDSAVRSNLTLKRISTVKLKIVKRTYGFHYENHFEKMLISIIGFKNLEIIENAIPNEIAIFDSNLSQLNTLRNHYAHTHLDVNSPYPDGHNQIPKPSKMKKYAIDILKALKMIEAELKNFNC